VAADPACAFGSVAAGFRFEQKTLFSKPRVASRISRGRGVDLSKNSVFDQPRGRCRRGLPEQSYEIVKPGEKLAKSGGWAPSRTVNRGSVATNLQKNLANRP